MPKRYRDIAGDGGSNVAGQVAEQMARLKARMTGVKYTVAVMSGKGGVGKSTITTNLATFFATQGWHVGVVDADINGPSLAKMFGVRGHQLRLDPNGVLPAIGPLGVQLISMDLFLAEDKTPVVWDGPTAETFLWRGTMEMHTLREFLSDVQWGALDLLLIDLPPGADRMSTMRDLVPDLHGTVVVTIPSAVSQLVVLKSITLARDLLHTPVIGLVENMTAYVCPTCQEVHPLFGQASTDNMPLGVPLLGRIPFDPRMAAAGDHGTPYVLEHSASPAGQALIQMGERVRTFFRDRTRGASKESSPMKFVCTECDEPMKFDQNGGLDEDGSMSATFRCPSCEWGVTLLINPQETQMVRSLGVKIGGATVPSQPMEMLQTYLANPSEAMAETSSAPSSSCPFSALVQDTFNTTQGGVRWSVEAEQRLERAPSFVRGMVRRGIEEFAREQGYAEITEQVMDEARARMGM